MGAQQTQRGIAQLAVILIVVVIALAGLIGWYGWRKNNRDQTAAGTISQVVKDAVNHAQCSYDDKDLCKFYAGYKAQPYYTATAVRDRDGQKSTTVMKVEGDTNYAVTVDKPAAYELIVKGDTTYVKASDDTWYKQPTDKKRTAEYKGAAYLQLEAPNASVKAKDQYKRLSKEACGTLTCLKYQFVSAKDNKTTVYLWFDDIQYQLRRAQVVNQDGTADVTYNYSKVTVATPSPVKDLAADQSFTPGQDEPAAQLPSTGDAATEAELQQLLQEYPSL